MFYNWYMKFNFGHYLNTIMPQKRMSLSREDFLSRIYDPIIEKFKIENKNHEPYIIGRELTSNLFRNKVNLPIQLQIGFEKADKESHLFYESFKNVFDELYSNDILSVYTNKLINEIVENKLFSKNINEKLREIISNGDLYKLHWFLFKTLGAMENRIQVPFRKQGRPSKNEIQKEFFYLSEEEKINEFNRMINNFSKDRCKITYYQFRYFLNSLPYVDIKVDTLAKRKILSHFFEIDFQQNHFSKIDNLKLYFEQAKDTLGRDEIFDEWIKLIPGVGVEIQIKILKKWYKNLNQNNITILYNEFDQNVDNDSMLKNDTFRKEFVINNFFLPDFLGSINHDIWSYCHYMAVLASKSDLKHEFVKYINEIRLKNNNNKTVNDRCDALIEKCERFQMY